MRPRKTSLYYYCFDGKGKGKLCRQICCDYGICWVGNRTREHLEVPIYGGPIWWRRLCFGVYCSLFVAILAYLLVGGRNRSSLSFQCLRCDEGVGSKVAFLAVAWVSFHIDPNDSGVLLQCGGRLVVGLSV